MSREYKPRDRFNDGIPRAAYGIFVDLTAHQVEVLTKLATDAGKKSLVEYLTDFSYTVVESIVPSAPPESTH